MWVLTGVSAQVKLSLNPEKGKKYEYFTESVQNIKTTVMGQEVPVEMIMSTKYMMEIIDKKPQETTVRFTSEEMAYIVSSPMMKMEYDSKNPTENLSDIDKMLAKMFDKMLGQSFLTVFAPDGSIISLTGMETIGESMANAISGDGPMGAQMGAQMKQQFSDNAMKNMFEQTFKIYPTNAVKVGNSWNIESTTIVNEMNSVFKTKYTLKQLAKNMATISVDAQIEMTPMAIMEGKLNGVQTGTITMETKTGLTIKSEIEQNTQGIVSTQGMQIFMNLTSKTTSSIKDVK